MKSHKKKIQFPNSILIFLSLIYSLSISQEIVQVFEQEEVTLLDPLEVNKYYFSLLPSILSKIVLALYSEEFQSLVDWSYESLLRSKIDKLLVLNNMSYAAFWGSFKVSAYENCLFRTAFAGGNRFCAQIYLARDKHPTYSRGEYDSCSPLGLAVYTKHPQIVKLLLSAGADPNHRTSDYDDYPIARAAQNNDATSVRLLLEKGANKDLEIALQWGASKNSTEIVSLLLHAGAAPHKAVSGPEALIEAASHQNPVMVQQLLTHGAKIDANRYPLRYALQVAVATNNTVLASILQNGGVQLP